MARDDGPGDRKTGSQTSSKKGEGGKKQPTEAEKVARLRGLRLAKEAADAEAAKANPPEPTKGKKKKAG